MQVHITDSDGTKMIVSKHGHDGVGIGIFDRDDGSLNEEIILLHDDAKKFIDAIELFL